MNVATTIDRRDVARPPAGATSGARRPVGVVVAAAALAFGAYAAMLAPSGDRSGAVARAVIVGLWALAGAMLVTRRGGEPLGLLIVGAALLSGVGSAAAEIAADATRSGVARDAADALTLLALAGLPAFGVHLIVGLPDGRVAKRSRKRWIVTWYVIAAGTAAALFATRPAPRWPLAIVGAIGAVFAISASVSRYQRARGLERQRMQWFGWAVTVGGVIAVVIGAFRVLADLDVGIILPAVATAPLPVALAISASPGMTTRIDRLLAHTVSIAGLTGLVVVTYVIVVVGLGEIPDPGSERTLLLLSMGAAAVAALLYIPTRDRLSLLANRIVYGEIHAPDEVLRTFGSRMSRAIAMDELLLQLAESLRKTFSLDAVEVWTGQEGVLERAASVPERGQARMTVGLKERPVFARAGVTGNAWLQVWMPKLLAGREHAMVRVAPIVHSGELLGFILLQRNDPEEQLGDENERVLTELARQVALALHNVQLDSALQATLDEVRKQADELRASRERIVATADATRRRLAGDLHDGAQQNLVALAVKTKLLVTLLERDPDTARQMVSDLATEMQEAVQAVRSFVHGIYPPLLQLSGLVAALESTASRAAITTLVQPAGEIPRYKPEIEAAVYFTCLEALTNASKHAGEDATVTITLKDEGGVLFFEVADDGAGFDAAERSVGAGFTNMADRVGAIGGTFSFESTPGSGTKISARVPVAAP